MPLLANWRAVLLRAWSIRFIALALIVQAIDLGLPFFYGRLPVDDAVFGWLTIAFGLAAGVSRLIPQKAVTPCP